MQPDSTQKNTHTFSSRHLPLLHTLQCLGAGISQATQLQSLHMASVKVLERVQWSTLFSHYKSAIFIRIRMAYDAAVKLHQLAVLIIIFRPPNQHIDGFLDVLDGNYLITAPEQVHFLVT